MNTVNIFRAHLPWGKKENEKKHAVYESGGVLSMILKSTDQENNHSKLYFNQIKFPLEKHFKNILRKI